MSIYELLDYDRLLDRIGIDHDQTWFCGDNPPQEFSYDEVGITYDDIIPYDGRAQHGPNGLCLTSDINVNGLTLNRRDANGTLWLCTNIEGWWTLPPSDIPDVPKPYWDGSLLTTGRYQTRVVTISGFFIPPDRSWVWYNRDLLIRVASIVRGVGLLAMCGNASPAIDENHAFYDPSKMAIIQMADVPLIETVKPNGLTQFSLSFKCVQPTKISIKEKVQTIAVGTTNLARAYASFSRTLEGGDTSGSETTYVELRETGTTSQRKYSDVKFYNEDAPIQDEDNIFVGAGGIDPTMLQFHNAGNYFAFPVYVFEEMIGAGPTTPLEISNTATGETMKIVKPIPDGKQLVIDTAARRIALTNIGTLPQSWVWDDRNFMSLSSSWVSLAAGVNQFIVTKDPAITIKANAPRAYWRDTWIG